MGKTFLREKMKEGIKDTVMNLKMQEDFENCIEVFQYINAVNKIIIIGGNHYNALGLARVFGIPEVHYADEGRCTA